MKSRGKKRRRWLGKTTHWSDGQFVYFSIPVREIIFNISNSVDLVVLQVH